MHFSSAQSGTSRRSGLRSGAWPRGSAVAGLLFSALASLTAGACSTYSRDIVQRPVASSERIVIRETRDPLLGFEIVQAVYTTPDFQLSAWVPFSGSRRVAFGPCLLPIVPGTKEFPQNLNVVLAIAPADGAQLRIMPDEWRAVLGKGDDLTQLEVDTVVRPFRIVSRAMADLDPLGGESLVSQAGDRPAPARMMPGEAQRFRLVFPEYDNRFDGFVLRGLRIETVAGPNRSVHEIPGLRFESTSRGRYTPFTTKILDL